MNDDAKVQRLPRPDGNTVAYATTPGRAPTVAFLGGFYKREDVDVTGIRALQDSVKDLDGLASGDLAIAQAGIGSKAEQFLNWMLGPMLNGASRDKAFVVVVGLILVAVILKNAFTYLSRLHGQAAQSLLNQSAQQTAIP